MEKLNLKNKLLLAMFLACGFLHGQEMQLIDKIIGVVGDEIILSSDHHVQKSELISRGAGKDIDCLVMENLLFEKLMLNQAKIDSIEIPDEQVELELEQRVLYFTQQFGSEEKMEDFYGKSIEKIKAEFRTLLKDQMLTQRMQGRLTSTAYVTPADVEAYFNSIPKDSLPLIGSEVEIAHIVIKPEPSKAEKRRAEERANQLRKDVIGGKDFALVASLYSDDPGSAAKGGNLGEARKGMMVSEFEAMAYNLDIGEVSPVFQTDFGFHFMQLVDRRGEIYECRHVLIKPVTSQEDISGSINLLDSIANLIATDSISFKDAAKKYSQDEDSKFSGGIILNPNTRSVRFAVQDVDPQMFFIIDKLDVGDVSEPVVLQYPDGTQAFRILKLLARTDPHQANMTDDYQLIQEMTRQEISQKSVFDWVNSTVKRTYIRIDEDFNGCQFDNQWGLVEN